MNDKMQIATLPTERTENGKWQDNKEQIAALALVAWAYGRQRQIVTARFWMSRSGDGASPVYCSVWLSETGHASGHGTARGYGYHKQSAALQFALDSAGVKLAQPIDGRGESAMRDAIMAIGRAMGYTDEQLLLVEV
jgi:hypothetical protein